MAEAVFKILKITVIVAVSAIFMLAINALITYITGLVFTNVIGEVLAVISLCLPFNALLVFGAIGTATNVVLTFLIAKKIFDLTSWSISAV